MFDLPPPPTEIVYEMPARECIQKIAENLINKLQTSLDYIVDHPEVLESLSKKELRKFQEGICFLALQGSYYYTPEEKEKLYEDIRNLLSTDLEDEEVDTYDVHQALGIPFPAYQGRIVKAHTQSASHSPYYRQTGGSAAIKLIMSSSKGMPNYEIIKCGILKKIGKGLKKIGEAVKDAVKDTIHFIKEHPVASALAIAGGVMGGLMLVKEATMSDDKKEEKHHPEKHTPPPPENCVPPPEQHVTVAPPKSEAAPQKEVTTNPLMENIIHPKEVEEPNPIIYDNSRVETYFKDDQGNNLPITLYLPSADQRQIQEVEQNGITLTEAAKIYGQNLASSVVHDSWDLFGKLEQTTSKGIELYDDYGRGVVGIVDKDLLSIQSKSPEQIDQMIREGHEKIDQFFGTNLKENYPKPPMTAEEAVELMAFTFISPAPQLEKAAVEALLPVAVQKVATGGALTMLKDFITKEEAPLLEAANASVQKNVDQGIEEVLAQQPVRQAERERTYFENNLTETSEEWLSNKSMEVTSTEKLSESLNIEKLAEAGKVYDRADLTKAGRALAKHGGREGSFFPKPLGNPNQINQQGQEILEGILNNPDKIIIKHDLPKFGNVIDVKIQGKYGVRFYENGEFIGFLEP